MRIAQIVSTFPPYRGGMGNSAFNFSKILTRMGYEVVVFTPSYNKKTFEVIEDNAQKFKIIRLKPFLKIGNASVLPQLFWRLKNFDVIILHYPFYGASEFVMLKKILFWKKTKLIIHYHMDNQAKGIKGEIFNLYRILFLPILVRMAKIITCASLDYVKHSNLSEYYLNNKKKFRQVLFGVDLNQFVTYQDHINEQRKEKVILFVGGLDKAHYFKGLKNLLKALKEIKKENNFKNIKLNIVGRGNLMDFYKHLAKDFHLEKEVNFYDQVDDTKLVDFYNYCDVLVLPSINKSEAFGLVLLEAMACTKPIIASNLPGVRSVFKNGKHGLLVKPGNVKDLVHKIKVIINDKKLAEQMGKNARALVENKYTWEKVGKRLEIICNYVKFSP